MQSLTDGADMDGTLTDSALGITRSVKYALKKYGIDETDHGKLQKFVGPPLKDSFVNLYESFLPPAACEIA